MKRLITIPLLFISLILSATNYYVKNGGNDADTGADDDHAWETITKVNASSFLGDDTIFFKCGDRFIGTLTPSSSGTSGHLIVFSAYGTGIKPVITPNDTIEDIAWSAYGSDGIYSTTDITYDPGNLLIDWEDKINKINNNWFTTSNSLFNNHKSLEILGYEDNFIQDYGVFDVYFWDGIDALYAYDSSTGTTYLRFRGGENPNDSILSISAENSKAVYINAKRYIKIQNLHFLGGEYGIYLLRVTYDGTDNIIIEDCKIESSNQKVYLRLLSNGITIKNDTITNNYLSSYSPGAWTNGTDYIHDVCHHYYEFMKYLIGTSESTYSDAGIETSGTGYNALIYNNVIINCTNGISNGYNFAVYDNYISGTSSVAIHFGEESDSTVAHDNYITNSNIPFRFQYINRTARTVYIYRNRVYIPDAGELMYIHYDINPLTGPSISNVYFYHNSIICKTGTNVSSIAGEYPEGTGFIFVNNIISASGNNSGPYTFVGTKSNLYVYYNNWTGGTFYGASGLPGQIAAWATDASNQNYVSQTFWNHSIDPLDFTDLAGLGYGDVVNEGVDVSATFTLGGVNYDALPGIDGGDYQGLPDIGYYEYVADNPITVTTTTPYWTSLTTATGGGNVLTEGAGTVSAKGICWNTTGTPDIGDDKTTDGTGDGAYSSTMIGLKFGTTYYVRAYATNELGTGYGQQYTFRQQLTKHNSKIIKHLGKFIVID